MHVHKGWQRSSRGASCRAKAMAILNRAQGSANSDTADYAKQPFVDVRMST